jgi:Uma2 family endonuclease
MRVSSETYYIPDVAVIPTAMVRPLRRNPRGLGAYGEPVPLVVEVWSPSTGSYDMRAKIPDYQERGDLEIWFIHPFTRTLTVWRRQPDGRWLIVRNLVF